MPKLLTISIAAYNVEKTIEDCLNSFLPCKHLDDLEILVINDGSHDRTMKIVSAYEEKYPGIISLIDKENGGHGSTINKSLSIATGKFFKVIDGDDWVNAEELDRLCDWLENCNSDLVINAFKWCYPDDPYEEHDEKGFKLHHVYTFDEMYSVHLSNTPIFPMTSITILTKNLLNIRMHIKEKCFYADNEFMLYCFMAANTISFDNSCAYQYRMGQSTQSVSSEGWYKHLEDYFSIFEDIISIYMKYLPSFDGTQKDQYILQFLDSYYSNLYIVMVDKITKSDKDYLLVETVKKFKQNYPNLYNRLKPYSLTARFLAENPGKRVVWMRYFRKTWLFKFLYSIKCFVE